MPTIWKDALKDPKVLLSTLLWIENHGRHQHPWNGRNSCIGPEDVCSYLAHGLEASMEENRASREGIKTFHDFTGEEYRIPHIQGVVKIPQGFTYAEEIVCREEGIRLRSAEGAEIEAKVDTGFLYRK